MCQCLSSDWLRLIIICAALANVCPVSARSSWLSSSWLPEQVKSCLSWDCRWWTATPPSSHHAFWLFLLQCHCLCIFPSLCVGMSNKWNSLNSIQFLPICNYSHWNLNGKMQKVNVMTMHVKDNSGFHLGWCRQFRTPLRKFTELY